MFPCMIARTATTDVISSGMGGTRNGALQLVEFYNSIINEHLINYFLLIILVYKKIKKKTFFFPFWRCMPSFKYYHLWSPYVKLISSAFVSNMLKVYGLSLMFPLTPSEKLLVLQLLLIVGGFLLAVLCKTCLMATQR